MLLLIIFPRIRFPYLPLARLTWVLGTLQRVLFTTSGSRLETFNYTRNRYKTHVMEGRPFSKGLKRQQGMQCTSPCNINPRHWWQLRQGKRKRSAIGDHRSERNQPCRIHHPRTWRHVRERALFPAGVIPQRRLRMSPMRKHAKMARRRANVFRARARPKKKNKSENRRPTLILKSLSTWPWWSKERSSHN